MEEAVDFLLLDCFRLSSRAKLVFSGAQSRNPRGSPSGLTGKQNGIYLALEFVNRTRKVAQLGDLPRLSNGVDNNIINNSMLRGTGICTFPKGVL